MVTVVVMIVLSVVIVVMIEVKIMIVGAIIVTVSHKGGRGHVIAVQ